VPALPRLGRPGVVSGCRAGRDWGGVNGTGTRSQDLCDSGAASRQRPACDHREGVSELGSGVWAARVRVVIVTKRYRGRGRATRTAHCIRVRCLVARSRNYAFHENRLHHWWSSDSTAYCSVLCTKVEPYVGGVRCSPSSHIRIVCPQCTVLSFCWRVLWFRFCGGAEH